MLKKVLIALIIAGLLFWIGVCLLIPNPLQVSSVKMIKAPVRKINELATNQTLWKQWWPGEITDTIYNFHLHHYSIDIQKPYSVQVSIKNESDTFTTHLLLLPMAPDSVAIEWKTELLSGINPFTRIKQYNKGLALKENLQTLLDSLSAFVTNKEKLYGFKIENTRFTNPFMITTQATFTAYPGVNNIYESINTLKAFAKAQQAQPVDSPMINIELVDAKNYLLRVALPVNKRLPIGKGIEFKQMVLGNTLFGTVTGGRYKIQEALMQMQSYISDYGLTSPAIPFQLLITNRQQQPDSSKWITKLYYPVF